MQIKEREESPWPIDFSKVTFSGHALWRFKTRFPELCEGVISEKGIEVIARKYLKQSNEELILEKNRPHYLHRLLNNKCEEAKYFFYKRMRFVIKAKEENGVHVVLTIERRFKKFGPTK